MMPNMLLNALWYNLNVLWNNIQSFCTNLYVNLAESIYQFRIGEIISVFLALFAVIDIIGAIPIIIDLKMKNKKIEPAKTSIYSGIILIAFLFVGQLLLSLFNVDLKSFAAAGGIILFVLAVEMIFGIEIFKDDSPEGSSSTFVPLVFPLIAGAASFTTLLSLRSQYQTINIIIAIVLNLIVVFMVMRNLYVAERIFGQGGIYVLRKFFGVILLAIAVKLFTENISSLVHTIRIMSETT